MMRLVTTEENFPASSLPALLPFHRAVYFGGPMIVLNYVPLVSKDLIHHNRPLETL